MTPGPYGISQPVPTPDVAADNQIEPAVIVQVDQEQADRRVVFPGIDQFAVHPSPVFVRNRNNTPVPEKDHQILTSIAVHVAGRERANFVIILVRTLEQTASLVEIHNQPAPVVHQRRIRYAVAIEVRPFERPRAVRVRKGMREPERAVTVVSQYRADIPSPEDEVEVPVHLNVCSPDAVIPTVGNAPAHADQIRDVGGRSVLFPSIQTNAALPRRHQIQPEIVVPVDRQQTVGAQWPGGGRRDGPAGRIQPPDGFLRCGQRHRGILPREAEHRETGGFIECFRKKSKRRIRGRRIRGRTLHLQEPSQWLAHRL